MKAQHLHDWQVTPTQAILIQRELAGRVSRKDELGIVRLVGGVDISVPKSGDVARGAVVILSYPELRLVESQIAEKQIKFPYVPGLLSFREVPIILAACEKLKNIPDLILVDGQGVAHPRRLGLASHLGLLWDRPTIGCAKSRLCGEHEPVGNKPGDFSRLTDGGETIGAVLRTKMNTKPIYVSIGHRIGLEAAIQWVLDCCRGYRLPEPTRLAHQAAAMKETTSIALIEH
jgi:deoxyribonuclease V